MEYAVEGGRNAKRFIEAIIPSMITQLKLDNCSKAVLIKVTNGFAEEGCTIPINTIGAYLVLIKPGTPQSMATTLAHELVHVKQMAKGQLKIRRNGGHGWMGKFYSKKTPYLEQPWEMDAFAKQEIIMRKAML